MRAGFGVNQLRGNSNSITALSDGAFEHVADAQFASDSLNIYRLSFVGKRGITGDNEQPTNTGERGDDFLGHPVYEVVLLRVAAHILERQDGNRWFVWKREGRRTRFVRSSGCSNLKHSYRPGNVLEPLVTEVVKGQIEP